MYVCVCHGITDRQINQAVDAGATSLRQVRKQLPVGSNCGRCLDCAAQVVKQRVASGEEATACASAKSLSTAPAGALFANV